MSDFTKGPSRPMKYPYTYAAKIAQFPYKFIYKNQPLVKYYLLGVLCTYPVFNYFTNLSYNPENVAKWNEIRRKEFSGEH